MEYQTHLIIEAEAIKEALKWELEREPTLKEYEDFLNYLEVDVPEWLKQNARCFVKASIENSEG